MIKVTKEILEHKAHKVRQVLLVPLAHKVSKVFKVSRVFKDRKETQAILVHRVQKVILDRKVMLLPMQILLRHSLKL